MNIIVVLKEISNINKNSSNLCQSDINVIQKAMDLKKESGYEVCVIGFSTEPYEKSLKEAYSYGVDRVVWIYEKVYKNIHISQWAKVISNAIRLIGNYSVVLFGSQSQEGDSIYIAAMISEEMGIPLYPYATEIHIKNLDGYVLCDEDYYNYKYSINVKPCVIQSIDKNSTKIYPTVIDIINAYRGNKKIDIFSAQQLGYQKKDDYVVTLKRDAYNNNLKLMGKLYKLQNARESAKKLVEIIENI